MFVVKPKAAVTAGEYKVSTKTPVHICCNASNSRHAFCVFAHCDDCHKKELERVAVMVLYNQGEKRGQEALDNDASRKSKRARTASRRKQCAFKHNKLLLFLHVALAFVLGRVCDWIVWFVIHLFWANDSICPDSRAPLVMNSYCNA